MDGDPRAGRDRAAELREAFDRSFAEAPPTAAALEDLLEIRLGALSYALRVIELAGLHGDIAITALPSRVPALLGIAAVRGAILPVYDLRLMLGLAADTTPRWVVIAAATPVGLACDGFDRHLRLRRDTIVPYGGVDTAVLHVRDVVHVDGRARPIISLPSVLDAITMRVRAAAPEKE